MCDINREVPNADFTNCIGEIIMLVLVVNIHYCHNLDREPDVSVNVVLGQRNAYIFDGVSTYQVGYGHEFGLECKTSFFEVQWKLNNQPRKSDIVCRIALHKVKSL